ncbi:MAG: hypothetical protein K9H62_13970 [Bacteroidales bacterium]|nr:hypothetical protein [Bacteroidales bacterium]
MKYKLIISLLVVLFTTSLSAQENTILSKLEDFASADTTLYNKIDLSVSDVSIQEFVNAISSTSKVNISIDPSIKDIVSYNFSDVMVFDVLLFLCEHFNLDVVTTGSIIHLKKADIIVEEKVKPPKELKISYNGNNEISLDLQNDSLYAVAKKITLLTGKNIVLAPGIEGSRINSFIQKLSVEEALQQLAFSNDLELKKLNDNTFQILAKRKPQDNFPDQGSQARNRSNSAGGNKKQGEEESAMSVYVPRKGEIDVVALNTPINELIAEVAKQSGENYILISSAANTVSLSLNGVSFEDFLFQMLNGTGLVYQKINDIYIVGENTVSELKQTRLIYLNYRTVEKLSELLPAELIKNLEVMEFIELNALVVSGTKDRIDYFESFIGEIDKLVPVILIEVIIIDNNSSHSISTGINAGIGKAYENLESGGTISPGVDFQLNTQSVNKLINSFNGFGWFNMGNVKPGFYLTLKAMEDMGVIKLRSTPMLSTLNGHEATMEIGNTEYYVEERHDVIGSQNPQNVTTRTFKPVKADLSLTIKPFLAGDEQITLEIDIQQSDFTSRISPDAPPGAVTRSFKSLIRVKNQEMVLLGGLEEKSTTETGSGLPLITRIPVLKWIFGSKTKANAKTKLNIFIKPVIIN